MTANGLMNVCDIIPRSSAEPGDLIFFQGTYDTSGASHVGIYVGNGMMIHCGNPISYSERMNCLPNLIFINWVLKENTLYAGEIIPTS